MVGYRTPAEPSIIRRSAELWPEGIEFYGPANPFPQYVPDEDEDDES